MNRRYFRIPLQEIGFVRSILEGYDGLAVLRARDPQRGEVEWMIAEGMEAEAAALISRLVREIGMVEIARPEDWGS